jgi:cobalt-zinc-cadmium efflux system protein
VHVHHHEARRETSRTLAVVLALTLGFAAVEAVGGWLADSLALLADAGHMLSDASSLGLALFAAWLATRPATPRRSFGFQRAEILAALANGLALVVIGLLVLVEAYRRLDDTPEVRGGLMLAVAVAGLAVNVVAALLLRRHGGESLNVSAALRHVLADVASSAGVIVAALVILTTGWEKVDPIVGALVGLLVLASSYGVLRDSVSILLETTPRGIDATAVGRAMASAPDVAEVHDLHIWTITSGFPALSAHVLVEPGADCHAIRRRLEQMLDDRFAIDHTTLQVEHVPSAETRVELGEPFRRATPLRRD